MAEPPFAAAFSCAEHIENLQGTFSNVDGDEGKASQLECCRPDHLAVRRMLLRPPSCKATRTQDCETAMLSMNRDQQDSLGKAHGLNSS